MANAKNERSLGFASLRAVGYWCLPHCRVPIINAVAGLGISCRSFAITQRVLELNIRGRSSGVAATRHVVCASPLRSLRTSAARPRDATRARTPRGPARRKHPPARHVVCVANLRGARRADGPSLGARTLIHGGEPTGGVVAGAGSVSAMREKLNFTNLLPKTLGWPAALCLP